MTTIPTDPTIEMLVNGMLVVQESFEAAPPFAFSTANGGTGAAWARDSSQFRAGSWSMKSGACADGQFTDFIITVPATATSCTYWYRIDAFTTDLLRTYVDSVQKQEFVGSNLAWTQSSLTVRGGGTLTFRYIRNAAGGANAAWIDDVRFNADGYIDITADCRLTSADSGGGIEISRGRPNEGNRAEPTQCNIVLNNGASRVPSTLGQSSVYSPRNPVGPYYGLLGRNQRIRVGLSRVTDTFNRTAVADGWGWVPDKTLSDGTVVPGPKWNLFGTASNFDTTGTAGTISAGTNQIATFGTYGDCEIKARISTSVHDSEFGIVARFKTATLGPAIGLDGTMENGLVTWTTSGSSTVASTSAQAHTGTKSMVVTVAGSPASASFANATAIPVTAGQSYKLRFWCRHSAGGNITQNISWYDASLVFVGSTSAVLAHSANVWTLNEFTSTAPTGAYFAKAGGVATGSPANGTQIYHDDWEFLDLSTNSWYSTYVTPGGTDQIRIGKVSPSSVWPSIPATTRAQFTNLSANVIVNTFYWMRTQITGTRIRVKLWRDGDPEPKLWTFRYYDERSTHETPVPLTGEVGVIVQGGTSVVTFDSIEINQWRAHAEIAELPPRWDLSRSDKWIPIQARGILRRLGQGRKALQSAMTLYLKSYVAASFGWWSLEDDTGTSAGNLSSSGLPAAVSGLTFAEPDLSGSLAIPGIAGYATLGADTSSFIASVPNHVNKTGFETFLFGFRLPNVSGTDVTIATITSTGTARKCVITILGGGSNTKIELFDKTGASLSSSSANIYFLPDHPVGCWLMATLLYKQNGGNIEWAFNFHRPGGANFYTINAVVAGSIGIFTGIQVKGSAAATAAGGISLTQVMHYAGDLPFVTSDFERAAYAYIGETAGARWLRLTANAGISATTTGLSTATEAMGAQLPAKLLDLLEECAEVEDGIMAEERDDFSLTLVTRQSLWNRLRHTFNIDAGHMSAPLEPSDDDQGTRNDVTVSRPSGSFARVIQSSGPLNVNAPEDDPNGVGTYDEAPDINFGTDAQLRPAASFRMGRGTQDEARYPSIHADLAASAYMASAALAAATISIDPGDVIEILNPEVAAEPREQQVASYTEKIDQFDWDLTYTAQPSSVYRVGVVNYTTRVDSVSNAVSAAFVSGTDTKLKTVLFDPAGQPFVTLPNSEISFPFDIDVAGVRLRVRATGDTLNSNPFFEPTLAGWVVTSANVTMVGDAFNLIRGTQCVRITSIAAGTDGIVQDSTASSVALPAVDYYISGWVKTSVAATDLRLVVDWYQSNNTTLISTSSPTAATTSANVWQRFEAVVTSPALTAFARLRLRNVFAGASLMWADELRIIPVSSYTGSPQTLTVEQVPVNGIIKTVPVGSMIRLASPWRVGW